jgi:hypothetical protein
MVRFKRLEIDEWMESNRNTGTRRRIERKKIPVGDKEKDQRVKAIARETIASVRKRNRKKQPDKGAGKEESHGTL